MGCEIHLKTFSLKFRGFYFVSSLIRSLLFYISCARFRRLKEKGKNKVGRAVHTDKEKSW